MPDKDTKKNKEIRAEMERHIDRILSGRQEIFGTSYDDAREFKCKNHLRARLLGNEKFVICDLLKVAYEYSDDPKLKGIILRMTSQAIAMQRKLVQYKKLHETNP